MSSASSGDRISLPDLDHAAAVGCLQFFGHAMGESEERFRVGPGADPCPPRLRTGWEQMKGVSPAEAGSGFLYATYAGLEATLSASKGPGLVLFRCSGSAVAVIVRILRGGGRCR